MDAPQTYISCHPVPSVTEVACVQPHASALQDCGFAPLLAALQEAAQSLIALVSPTPAGSAATEAWDAYHAFLVRNWVGRDCDHKIHCDRSALTLNICLHASPDLVGSTVGFYYPGPDPAQAPSESERAYTHVHRVGYAVAHSGQVWHKADMLTQGTRGSLIVWLRPKGQDCGACDAPVDKTWRFCKACGEALDPADQMTQPQT